MTEDFPDLILEYGETIFPYLKLRSLAKNNDFLSVGDSGLSPSELKTLEVSGFIRQIGNQIQINKDGRPIYLPEEKAEFIRPITKEYVPNDLKQLVELVGYPVDWHKTGKYRNLLKSLRLKHSLDDILKVATWAKENVENLTLNLFLTAAAFKGFKFNMENPKKPQFEDRVSKESYEESDFEI